MTWFKLDDNFPDNPKVVAAVESAGLGIIGLFVSAGCYCSRQETDGRFPKSMAIRFGGTKRLIDALVTSGLWHDVDDEYEIHDFLEYNPSKADLDSKRKAKSMAGAMGAAKRWASVSHDTPNAPDPTRPVYQEHMVTPPAQPFEAEFAEWWAKYPRKADRKAAFGAYTARRRQGVNACELTEARDRYVLAKVGTERQYLKHGATFLAKDGPWTEYLNGTPDPLPEVRIPPPTKPEEQAPRRCKLCSNTGNYVKAGVLTACKVHEYA